MRTTRNIITKLKNLRIHKHVYEVIRWHWIMGTKPSEAARIEAEIKCCICGKEKYHLPRVGSKEEEYFIESLHNKKETIVKF